MRAIRNVFLAGCLSLFASQAFASGPMGICGVIERVVFEPDAAAPERVRVYGAFAYYDGQLGNPIGFTEPTRGYLYFSLPADSAVARREWVDLASVAETGEAVAFGAYGYFGRFQSVHPGTNPPNGITIEGLEQNAIGTIGVRAENAEPTPPALYVPGYQGVTRLGSGNYDGIVAELKSLLAEER